MMLNIITLSLLASLLFGAQSTKIKKSTQTTQSTPIMHTVDNMAEGSDVSASMSRSVEIRYGQEVLVPVYKFKIKFVAVPDDSRCPEGVNCVWAGNGRIALLVSQAKRKAARIELNTTTEPHEATYANYKIKLENLTPRPLADRKLDVRDYVATLVVSKKS